jgi:hypothetical protein
MAGAVVVMKVPALQAVLAEVVGKLSVIIQ